jgi:hypothetical protein
MARPRKSRLRKYLTYCGLRFRISGSRRFPCRLEAVDLRCQRQEPIRVSSFPTTHKLVPMGIIHPLLLVLSSSCSPHHGELPFKQQMARGIHINPLHSLLSTSVVFSNDCRRLELSPPIAVLSPQQILRQLVTLILTLALTLTSLQLTIFLTLKRPRSLHGLPHLMNTRHGRKTTSSLLPLESIFTTMVFDICHSFPLP